MQYNPTDIEIELKNVCKRYSDETILNNISLSMPKGDFIVLVGPSGCGKSTLLRMIAGLEDITNGDIIIGGTVVNEMPAKKRDIAMVFQSYALYPHMNVAENMSFALRLAGTAKPEIAKRVQEAAEILGLENHLKRLPKDLSGGQRQRVAMGRAIVRNPRAFLFDEPLSNLDAKLRVRMRSEIKKLHQRLGKTTVYVTHDQTEAMTMADTIVVLNKGNIEQAGPPLELYNNPNNTFVASFIGSPEINLISGTIESSSVNVGLCTNFELPNLTEVKDKQKVLFGIRPQHIQINVANQSATQLVTVGDSNTLILAEITLVEPTGDSQEIHVTLLNNDGSRASTDISLRIVTTEELILSVGQTFTIEFDRAKIMLFTEETGQRIR